MSNGLPDEGPDVAMQKDNVEPDVYGLLLDYSEWLDADQRIIDRLPPEGDERTHDELIRLFLADRAAGPWPSRAVAGRCPSCGYDGSLFLGDGGFVTCSRAECPDPGKAADLLDRPAYHVVELGEDGWALQHEVTCFPNLLDCDVHKRVDQLMAMVDRPPLPPGRYRFTDTGQLAPLEVTS
jgi:hypothetical protein